MDLSSPAAHAAYAEALAAESRARKDEAIAWARQAGHSVHAENGNRISELMALWEGRPVFYATANLDAATVIATDRVRDMAPWNLDGEGLAVGVWDSAGVLASHQEFEGLNGTSRVMIRDSFSTSAHSTHVAATIGATGIDPLAKGMAPRVRIESYNWNDDTAQMFVLAASASGQPGKIYVSNHSYGIMAGWEYFATEDLTGHAGWHWLGTWAGADSWEEWFGQYTGLACNWDNVAYLHPYYLAFAAAGNDRGDTPVVGETAYYWLGSGWKAVTYDPNTCPGGDGEVNGGYGTVCGPSVAKNIMTVGAVVDAMAEETRSLAHAAMTDFSSWGPTDDGRVKPDIVANGTNVYSATNEDDNAYDTYDGTSMASPTACGSAVLLVQHYGQLFPGQAMRSSTLKALIIHTADDLGEPGPDGAYGWGLMNTEAAAELITRNHDDPIGEIMTEGLLDNNSNTVHSYYFHSTGDAPIRITLCWTDYYARTTTIHDDRTALLVHDLDLRLIGPDGATTYFPYVLDPVHPEAPASTGDNAVDNVEQIYVATPSERGVYEIHISHKGHLAWSRQHYSLISSASLSNQRPPQALDATVFASVNQPVTLTLGAIDDDRPVPPGITTFTIASLPEHGQLELPNGTLITESTSLINHGNQVVYRPDPDFVGTDHLMFYADDGGSPPSGGLSNMATVTLSVKNLMTVAYQVSAGDDDAFAMTSGGYQNRGSTELLVGQYCSGMRFSAVQIPQGSEITSARLRISVEGDSHVNGLVQAQATGNALDFSLAHSRVNDRPRTNAAVEWSCAGNGDSDNWQLSPDICGVIQEIVDQPDWSAGNSLVVIFSPVTREFPGLTFAAFEKSSSQAATLDVTYAPASDTGLTLQPPPGQVPPTAAATQIYVTGGLPATIALEATDDGLPAELAYTIVSLPEHGTLSCRGVLINQSQALPDLSHTVVYTPDAGFTGDDYLAFYADDGGVAPVGGPSNMATVTIKVRNLVTHQFEVMAATDDAHGTKSSQLVTSSMLAVGRHSSAMRFRNINVPQDSEIVDARLLLCMATTLIEHRIEGLISAEANDMAPDFTDGARRVADLPQTVASVPWAWDVGESCTYQTYYRSPDIGSVVQEIVSRPGWFQGNAMTILYAGAEYNSQDLEFFACDDARSDRAAKLEITYAPRPDAEPITPLPPDGTPPIVEDVSVGTSVNTPVTITLVGTDDGLPGPPGTLTYAIASLPSHGALARPDGTTITQPTTLPDYGNELIYHPNTGFQGQDSFTFHVDDGGTPPSGGTSESANVSIMVRSPATDGVTQEFRVIASTDDGYASPATAFNNLDDYYIRVGLYTTGMRFTNVNIPWGSTIISAKLKMYGRTLRVKDRLESTIQAEATGYAANFQSSDRHICRLARTNASVRWVWEEDDIDVTDSSWRSGAWYTSPDLYAVVQEVVDRPDWSDGNAIALILSSDSPPEGNELRFWSYDGNAPLAGTLEITYAPAQGMEPPLSPVPEPSTPTAENADVLIPWNLPAWIELASNVTSPAQSIGSLSYTIVDLPQHGTLECLDGSPIVANTVVKNHGSEIVYRPQWGFEGSDSFTYFVTDSVARQSNTVTVDMLVRRTKTSVTQIEMGEDDASAPTAGAFVNDLHEGVLSIGRSSSGLRFRNVQVPQGSHIVSAEIHVCSYTRRVREDLDISVLAEATGDAAGFSGVDRCIPQLPQTEARATWSWEGTGAFHSLQGYTLWDISPDISEVIKEIIDRPDWSSGNAIAIICLGDATYNDNARYEFFSCDNEEYPNRGAKLKITYMRE